MKRLAVLSLIAIALAGCVKDGGATPSYVGLSDLDGSEAANAATADNSGSASVRHIPSNKILGAMAFQKVTGRAVDPGRLDSRN